MKQLTPKQMIAALQLLATNKEWRKELRKAYRSVSKIGASYGRASMRSSGSRQLARAARGVKAGSNASQGYVRTYGWVKTSTTPLKALAPTWGTKGPTGWLAKIEGTTSRNNPPWVTKRWEAAVAGQGPYGLNDGLAEGKDKIVGEFERVADELITRAFRSKK